MTPVGHSLTGLAICSLVVPGRFSFAAKTVTSALFILLANAPDFPIPGWGHDRYDISHSLLVTFLLSMTIALFVEWRMKVTPYYSSSLIVGGVMAWHSHLLLDTFYNHGHGLAMFWPFSNGRLALPFPFFRTMETTNYFSASNLQIFAIETLFYGAILIAALFVRLMILDRRKRPTTHIINRSKKQRCNNENL